MRDSWSVGSTGRQGVERFTELERVSEPCTTRETDLTAREMG